MASRTSPALALAMLATCFNVSAARSAWSPDGNRVSFTTNEVFEVTAVPLGSGGVLAAWTTYAPDPPGGSMGVYAQALDAQGRVAAGWPEAGLRIVDEAGMRRSLGLAPDGFGGAYLAWQQSGSSGDDLYLQHVTATGSIFPGWPAQGRPVADSVGLSAQTLGADGEGGVFIGWTGPFGSETQPSHWLLRLAADGTPAPGWPAAGVELEPHGRAAPFALSPDGAGGVFLAWPDGSPYIEGARLFVHRLTREGLPYPAWPIVGAVLGEGPFSISQPVLVPDRNGGVYASWVASAGVCPLRDQPVLCPDCDCPVDQLVTHLDGQGSPTEGWSVGGRSLGGWSKISLDDTGGLLAAGVATSHGLMPPFRWSSRGVVTRLRADGSLAPGWVEGGNPVCSEPRWQWFPDVVADGLGGAFTCWLDNRIGPPVLYVSRLTSAGAIAPGWPMTGSIAAPAAVEPYSHVLVRSGPEDAIVVWIDRRAGNRNVYADQVIPGPAGPPAPLDVVGDGAAEFGIARAWPNPARAGFWITAVLPEASPATLDLVDIAGRVVESRRFDFAGPARGAVRLNADGRLEPGIYWVRLRQGIRSAAMRVTVVR